MKQIQWATASVSGDLRQKVEELLNQDNPWELHSWKVIGQGVDVSNQPVVNIVVCMTREAPDVGAKVTVTNVKVEQGKSKKDA